MHIRLLLSVTLLFLLPFIASAQERGKTTCFRVMEYNVENLFDCTHDSLKNDHDFTPEGLYQWTPLKYWRKVNAIARAILLASTYSSVDTSSSSKDVHAGNNIRQKSFYKSEKMVLPDIIGLCEVENDSVLFSLTKRSLLKTAGYEYVVTSSPDLRGVDVALLYQPIAFQLLNAYPIRINPLKGMSPTRDVLYVHGNTFFGDLHVFVLHAPSRRGGEGKTRAFRRHVVERVKESVDSIRIIDQNARVIVMGDFNDYSHNANLRILSSSGMTEITSKDHLSKQKGIGGTYRYLGEWGSLDHIFISSSLLPLFSSSKIGYHPSLVEEDEKHGGVKPFRHLRGPIYNGGFSDHLPLIADFLY